MSVGSVIIGYLLYFHSDFHRKAQEQQKKVVVAGCVPQAQPRMDYLKGLSIIGVCYLTNIYDTQIQKECVFPIDSLTRHSPGCRSAVSYSIFASLRLSGSIDLLGRIKQHYLMETRKPLQSKKAGKYLDGG